MFNIIEIHHNLGNTTKIFIVFTLWTATVALNHLNLITLKKEKIKEILFHMN